MSTHETTNEETSVTTETTNPETKACSVCGLATAGADTHETCRPTTSEWAQEHGERFLFSVALDNHEPTRNYGNGHGWRYERLDDNRGPGIILDVTGLPIVPGHCIFLIDDGRTVEVMYLSGWSQSDPTLFLSPMPVNVNEDGTARLRKNDDRPVDFSSWQLGPSKAWHLKIHIPSTRT